LRTKTPTGVSPPRCV